jgi:hypothetical protein
MVARLKRWKRRVAGAFTHNRYVVSCRVRGCGRGLYAHGVSFHLCPSGNTPVRELIASFLNTTWRRRAHTLRTAPRTRTTSVNMENMLGFEWGAAFCNSNSLRESRDCARKFHLAVGDSRAAVSVLLVNPLFTVYVSVLE